MQESDARLVGFGLGELQQGADLEALSIASVTSLEEPHREFMGMSL